MHRIEKMNLSIDSLNNRIIKCQKCPRLYSYIKRVGMDKVKRYKDHRYWARPLPGFGDPNANLLLIGLAPAAHGGNRTGRMFTGDSSGDWVAKVLYETGFATKPTSLRLGDGFELIDAYITAAVRCAPPQNKPLREEIKNCSEYLREELSVLRDLKVIVCLGRVAFDSCCRLLDIRNEKFSHNHTFRHRKWIVICSYHPSRQNTQTGRLDWKSWKKIFVKAKKLISNNT